MVSPARSCRQTVNFTRSHAASLSRMSASQTPSNESGIARSEGFASFQPVFHHNAIYDDYFPNAKGCGWAVSFHWGMRSATVAS
jgi:hypothetical protein